MKVNNCLVGKSSCPSEIVPVKLSNGSIFHVRLNYDNGAQHSLSNEQVHPLIISKRKSTYPIELSTVTSNTKCTRPIAKLKINDFCFESIMVKI